MELVLSMTLTPEQIVDNFEKYRGFLEGIGDRSEAALKLVDHLGERLASCPASTRKDYHNAFVGGLVDHSLRVLTTGIKLCKSMGWTVSKESLVIACLFHDLGKVGDDVDDYYVPQDSDWHRDKLGEMFKHNPTIRFMTVTDRALWLCQQFGLVLTHDEWLAIKLSDGHFAAENAAYKMKEPDLAVLVHHADLIATRQEKHVSQSHTLRITDVQLSDVVHIADYLATKAEKE